MPWYSNLNQPVMHLSYIWCLFILAVVGAYPAVQNADLAQASEFVGYVSELNVRGTVSLVLSCLLTLVLCVWSALHLIVPEIGVTRIQAFFCVTRWIVTGVYAPELVVFTAWRQWASARLLDAFVATMYTSVDEGRKDDRPGRPGRGDSTLQAEELDFDSNTVSSMASRASSARRTLRYKWTRTHSFFATTGGFAFEITGDDDPSGMSRDFLPKDCPARLTLTARGIALLAKCGHLPDISEKDIRDKSKANSLAKSLVLVQASWMLLQTIGRLAVHLPVTLLEVNTIAHVACMFGLYALWWHKPLLPNEPFLLRDSKLKSLCAFMLMSSEISGFSHTKNPSSAIEAMVRRLEWFSKTPECESVCLQTASSTENHVEHAVTKATNITISSVSHFQSNTSNDECVTRMRSKQLEKAADTAFFERRPRIKVEPTHFDPPSPTTQRRWNLAADAIREYPEILQDFILFKHLEDTCIHLRSEDLLARRVQNWPSDDLMRSTNGLTVGMILWLASFLYGAIHAAAWNEHFPSAPEKWLWRVSAIYMAFCGGLWIVLNYVAQKYRWLNEFWENWMDGHTQWYFTLPIACLVCICGTSFILARLYIVVEAIISVRSLPADAYVTPDWTQLFPHL